MKIISKFKDYYDYMVGTYTLDPTVVYDRRPLPFVKFDPAVDIQVNIDTINEPVGVHDFYICNRHITLFEYKGTFYHTPEQLDVLNELLIKHKFRKYQVSIEKYSYDGLWHRKKKKIKKNRKNIYNTPTDINRKERQPVLYEKSRNLWAKKPENYAMPLLSSFQFHKVFTPDEIYQMIYAFQSWLKDNPPIPDTQTNEGKILSAGFDLKQSFRHRKKPKK